MTNPVDNDEVEPEEDLDYEKAEPDDVLFAIYYACPDCGHEWQAEGTSVHEADCPFCGERNISPSFARDAE